MLLKEGKISYSYLCEISQQDVLLHIQINAIATYNNNSRFLIDSEKECVVIRGTKISDATWLKYQVHIYLWFVEIYVLEIMRYCNSNTRLVTQ